MLAERIGVDRAHVARIEAGKAAGAPLEIWYALGEALGRPFRAEFVRDRLDEPADAGHLAIQELVLRLAKDAGYEGGFELPSKPSDPGRSIDVALRERRRRRMVVVECWNGFGDLGAAARSSNRKLAEALALAAGLGWTEGAYEVGLCWVVRDTARNRELIARYEHIFAARLPGSSAGWVEALTRGGPLPRDPGLVWCDVRATRLFARRTRR
ncbi:MAG TPA: helix-turn-helix transcriptional regulator [Candidatus Limnocylindria bacterium]|nr:helix-turn-helix transcriptional regulator [Candidatus Limnocylindria bacterium]